MSLTGNVGFAASLSIINSISLANAVAARSITRLASGLRINRSSDDPAGLVISERMRSSIRDANRRSLNAMDEIGMLRVADSAMGEIAASVQEIRELSVYAANSVLTADDRAIIQEQIDAQVEHINTIASQTQFNSQPLLSGNLGFDASATALVLSGINVTSPGFAGEAISIADDAISQLSSYRSGVGARQNRLESEVRRLDVEVENLIASESRIRDANLAQEITQLTAANLQVQIGFALLAQANQNQGMVLGLLAS